VEYHQQRIKYYQSIYKQIQFSFYLSKKSFSFFSASPISPSPEFLTADCWQVISLSIVDFNI